MYLKFLTRIKKYGEWKWNNCYEMLALSFEQEKNREKETPWVSSCFFLILIFFKVAFLFFSLNFIFYLILYVDFFIFFCFYYLFKYYLALKKITCYEKNSDKYITFPLKGYYIQSYSTFALKGYCIVLQYIFPQRLCIVLQSMYIYCKVMSVK